jgi:magnesium-protoporphyrin O-methyltransferase
MLTYETRRSQIETYFDRTAVDAWSRLTSDAPVGRIRATVRAGRDRMRATMLGWLPDDLTGRRILDAGCGPGAFAIEVARRGADVVAVDLSAKLIELARERFAADPAAARIDFRVGDMLDPALGAFDHVVTMDALIHYDRTDMAAALAKLAARTRHSIQFTVAPRTRMLAVMHATGRLFPRGNRSPAIEPVHLPTFRTELARTADLKSWRETRGETISAGFYTSHAIELVRR